MLSLHQDFQPANGNPANDDTQGYGLFSPQSIVTPHGLSTISFLMTCFPKPVGACLAQMQHKQMLPNDFLVYLGIPALGKIEDMTHAQYSDFISQNFSDGDERLTKTMVALHDAACEVMRYAHHLGARQSLRTANQPRVHANVDKAPLVEALRNFSRQCDCLMPGDHLLYAHIHQFEQAVCKPSRPR